MSEGHDPIVRERLGLERERLVNELAAMRGELDLSSGGGTLPPFARDGQDDIDVASETVDREVSRSIELGLLSQIDEVDAAVRRLDAGTYGVCTTCHRPIAVARLEALPWTSWCVEHATIAEYRGDRRADPEEPASLLELARTSDDEDGFDPDEGSAERSALHIE